MLCSGVCSGSGCCACYNDNNNNSNNTHITTTITIIITTTTTTDLHINWKTMKYYILLDDNMVTKQGGEDFKGSYVNGLRISLTRAVGEYSGGGDDDSDDYNDDNNTH